MYWKRVICYQHIMLEMDLSKYIFLSALNHILQPCCGYYKNMNIRAVSNDCRKTRTTAFTEPITSVSDYHFQPTTNRPKSWSNQASQWKVKVKTIAQLLSNYWPITANVISFFSVKWINGQSKTIIYPLVTFINLFTPVESTTLKVIPHNCIAHPFCA